MWYSKGVIVPPTYYFNSYGDSSCEQYIASGSVQPTGVTSSGYTQLEVKTNTSHDPSWIGQKFYVDSDAKTDGSEAYQLYSDAGTTGTGIYVKVYTTAPTHDISITVTDGENPVQGATVVIEGTSKTTGSAGGCTVNGVPIGDHTITDKKTGFEDYSDTITVDADYTSFTIILEEEST